MKIWEKGGGRVKHCESKERWGRGQRKRPSTAVTDSAHVHVSAHVGTNGRVYAAKLFAGSTEPLHETKDDRCSQHAGPESFHCWLVLGMKQVLSMHY